MLLNVHLLFLILKRPYGNPLWLKKLIFITETRVNELILSLADTITGKPLVFIVAQPFCLFYKGDRGVDREKI